MSWPRISGARLGGIELAEDVQLRRGWKVEQFLELCHVVRLAAALQDIDALLGGEDRVTVEIGGALLELGEILDGLQRPLRAEQALDVHAAQRRCLDAMAMLLRATRPSCCVWGSTTFDLMLGSRKLVRRIGLPHLAR
jgi:hypothetical protein